MIPTYDIVWQLYDILYVHTCQGTLIKSNSTASSSFQSKAHDIHLVERFANFEEKPNSCTRYQQNEPCHSYIYPILSLPENGKRHAIHLMRLLCDISWQQPFGMAFVWRNPGFDRCFTSFCPWLGSQVSHVNKLILIFWIIAVYFFVDWIHAYLRKSVWGLGNCRFLGTTGDGGCGWWTGVLRCLKWWKWCEYERS